MVLSLAVTGSSIVSAKKETSIKNVVQSVIEATGDGGLTEKDPLSIEYMREQSYPGSEIVIEQILPDGSNYKKYIASYRSDGLKIYSLLTIPSGTKPERGWPVIIFNHGYIPPSQYRTGEKYKQYTDMFSRNGFIVFMPDFRGHGNSEGNPEGAYYSPSYSIDVLNALSSVKKFPEADRDRIGMWGHSMGGNITLRAMVVNTKDVKAGVIWAGVVADYEDMANNWTRSKPFVLSEREKSFSRPNRQTLVEKYGNFQSNPDFWKSIAPISFVNDISSPVQIHHGSDDEEVPVLFSRRLEEALKREEKVIEFYQYDGDDHNISNNLELALERSKNFFNKYLKKDQ